MNRYSYTQLLSLSSCLLALIVWYVFPGHDLYADQFVGMTLSILQLVIIPNAFLGLLVALISLTKVQLKALSARFLGSMMILWGSVIALLLLLWLAISIYSNSPNILATFSASHAGIAFLIPAVMLLAIIMGLAVNAFSCLSVLRPGIQTVQYYSAKLFDYIFLLMPILVFFVVLKFLTIVNFEYSMIALKYFLLSLCFVITMLAVIFPFLYYSAAGISFYRYLHIVGPICLMTFLAGDSIAAIPLITLAVTQELNGDIKVSRILTIVVICFPWVGELANLLFPIYSATLEGYGLSTILSIVSVGPFFMFTDPYISIPSLMSAFNFPPEYQMTYLTLALLTDHMFEVCEAVAVLFVVLRLKMLLKKTELISV